MIRIAFVIDTIVSSTAGTEKQLLMLLHGLDRKRFTPYLVCLRKSDWLAEQSFPFEVKYFYTPRIMSLDFLAKTKQFGLWCDDQSIDIVQTFFADGNRFGTFGARRSQCRPVLISSRRNMGHAYGFVTKAILRFLERWTWRYLANSRAAANHTIASERVPADKVAVIYNGLDLSRFVNVSRRLREDQRQAWQVEPDQILVGMVANLRDVKNVDSLVRVAGKLSGDFPSLRFVVVGEGRDRPRLQALIDAKGLTSEFLLAGQYLDVLPCLMAFDFAVLCSRFESFSNSLVEYMAAGLPIVASDVGGNCEAVTHGETGLLYDVADENRLEHSLRKLLEQHDLAKTMGQNARDSASERFGRESCLRQHQDYYQSLVPAAAAQKAKKTA